MSNDEKFDKIIKQKVSEAEFPFDENNWQKASRMIDAERGATGGAKSSKLFLLFGALFLGVATIAFFTITMGDNAKGKSEIAQNQNANTESVSNQGNQSASVLQNNSNNQTVSENLSINNNNSNSSNQNNSNGKNNNTSIASSENSNSSENKEVLAAKSVPTGKTEPNTAETNLNNDPNVKAKTGVEPIVLNAATSKPTEKSANVTKQPKVLGAKAKSTSVKSGNNAGKETNNKVSQPINEEVLNAAAITNVVSEGYDYLEMHSSVLQIWKKDELIKTPAHDFIRIYDEDYYKKSRRKTHFMNVEAGGTYLFGWQTKKGNDAEGFNAFGGLNYGLYLSKKLSVTVGAQFYNISHIKNPFYSRANYSYGFGANGNYTNITANNLYYVSLPVKVYQNIFKSAKIGVGVNTGILVGAKNTVETYTERDLVKTNLETVTEKGVYEGLNKTNVLLSGFYNYRLNQRVSLNAEFIYSVSDTYKSIATQNNSKEHNMGVRLSVQITLFDK